VKKPLTQANEYGKRQKVRQPKLPLVIGAISMTMEQNTKLFAISLITNGPIL
jgi:hypothetical protein